MSSQQTTTICTLLPIEALVQWWHNLSQLVYAPWKISLAQTNPSEPQRLRLLLSTYTVVTNSRHTEEDCHWNPEQLLLPQSSASCKNVASEFSLAVPSGGAHHRLEAGVTGLQMFWTCTKRVLLRPILSVASVAISRSSLSLSNWCTAPDTVSFPSPWITLFLRNHVFQRIIRILHLICSELGISVSASTATPNWFWSIDDKVGWGTNALVSIAG